MIIGYLDPWGKLNYIAGPIGSKVVPFWDYLVEF